MYTKFWSQKLVGKRPLGRPRRRGEEIVRMGNRVGRCEVDASGSG
jgi:hypothetical protein